jgi:hypothetical protein
MRYEKFFRTASRFAEAVALILFLVIPGYANAAIVDQLRNFEVAEKPAESVPSQGAASPITPYKGLGTGTFNIKNSVGGEVCPDAATACNASNGVCECDVFNGVVTLPSVGKPTSMTLNITSDDGQEFNNGQGECFPGSGHGYFCNKSGKSCLVIFVTGSVCTDIISEPIPGTAAVDFNVNETFYILPSASTGRFAGASGGGNLQIADGLQIVDDKITSNAGYTFLDGEFQSSP